MVRRMIKHAAAAVALSGALLGAYGLGAHHEGRRADAAVSYLAGELDAANEQTRKARARADRLAVVVVEGLR